MKLFKKAVCLTMVLCMTAVTGCGRLNSIRFGAADIGGMYYTFANTFTAIASEQIDKSSFEVRNTAGSVANLRLLSSRYIDLGIAQADLISDAYTGSGDFKDNALTGYRAVANLYTEACQIVVMKDSGIESVDDLQGKKISIGEEESGTKRNAEQILSLSGLTSDIIETVNYNYTEAAEKLSSGQIDAFFCTAGTRTTIIEELARQYDIRLISLDDKCISKLMSAFSYYSEYTIPSGTYTGQSDDIKTIGVKSVLLASDKLSDTTVNQLTKVLFEHAKEIAYSTSLDSVIDIKEAVKGIPVPLHSGAASYYEQQGIDTSSLR